MKQKSFQGNLRLDCNGVLENYFHSKFVPRGAELPFSLYYYFGISIQFLSASES